MKTASCKAKGRRASQEAAATIVKASAGLLLPADVRVTSSSVVGEDLLLSPKAMGYLPVVIEVKCQERLNFWAAIEQAESHCAVREPIVIFKRNREKLRCIVDLNYFLGLHFPFSKAEEHGESESEESNPED